MNNCVGHRNYTSFFAFLMSAVRARIRSSLLFPFRRADSRRVIAQVLTLALVICTSATHIYLLTRRDDISFGRALGKGAGSAVAFSLAMLVIWPITALMVYHMRLLLLNVTTIEQVRSPVFSMVTFISSLFSLSPFGADPEPGAQEHHGRPRAAEPVLARELAAERAERAVPARGRLVAGRARRRDGGPARGESGPAGRGVSARGVALAWGGGARGAASGSRRAVGEEKRRVRPEQWGRQIVERDRDFQGCCCSVSAAARSIETQLPLPSRTTRELIAWRFGRWRYIFLYISLSFFPPAVCT